MALTATFNHLRALGLQVINTQFHLVAKYQKEAGSVRFYGIIGPKFHCEIKSD